MKHLCLAIALTCGASFVIADDDDFRKFEEFITYYHAKPEPNRVPEILSIVLDGKTLKRREFTGENSSTRQATAQAFGHMARGNEKLVRQYESLIPPAAHSEREFLLDALEICGDKTTAEQLGRWASDDAFKDEKATIDRVRKSLIDPKRQLPRQREPQLPSDLDLLWSDFLVTGEFAPVEKILDVLERPGELRGMLEGSLAKKENRRELLAALKDMKLLEAGSKDKLKAGDLEFDMLFDARGRVRRSAIESLAILGVQVGKLSEEQLAKGLMLQGVAAWSLHSNFNQHAALEERLREVVDKRPPKTQSLLKKWLRMNPPADLDKAFEPLQGVWRITTIEENGEITKVEADDKFKTQRVIIAGNEATIVKARVLNITECGKELAPKVVGTVEFDFVITLDNKTPDVMSWQMVGISDEPALERESPKMIKRYDIQGDTLRLCSKIEKADRPPVEITAAKGSGQSVWELRRIKK